MKKYRFHHYFAEPAQQNFSRRPGKLSPAAASRLFWLDYASPAAVFSTFSTKRRRQKHCQHRLILSFLLSGTHYAGLLRANRGSLAKKVTIFPQTGRLADSGNYIKSYQLTDQTRQSIFLKKSAKLTDQTGSNYIAITANLCN